MNLYLIDPSRTIAKASGEKTGPTAVTSLLAAKPGASVKIRYGCFPEAHVNGLSEEQLASLESDTFTVDKTEGDKTSPIGVVRISGHFGDDDNCIEATATVYMRYGRLGLLRIAV
jgi:hypothetical protein